jgi:hypothetical protein
MFFKWTVFPKVSFNSTISTPRTEEVDPFPIRMEEDRAPGKKRTETSQNIREYWHLYQPTNLKIEWLKKQMVNYHTRKDRSHHRCHVGSLLLLSIYLSFAVSTIFHKMSSFSTHKTCSIVFFNVLLEVSGFLRLTTGLHLSLILVVVIIFTNNDICTSTILCSGRCAWSILGPCLFLHVEGFDQTFS